MRIIHFESERYTEDIRTMLESVGSVKYWECSKRSEFVDVVRANDPHAIFVRLGLTVDSEIFSAAPSLRWVVTPTTGLDHIDLVEAESAGIRVLSLKGEGKFLENIRSTGEHTLGLMLALMRHIPSSFFDVRNNRWRRNPFLGEELYGKTLGVIGAGRLGRMVANYALSFGMNVIAHDVQNAHLAKLDDRVEPVAIDDLLKRSDVCSLHLPLDATTKKYFDRTKIAQLKRGAFFINTARGELVDETALIEALTNGKIRGAALDVVSDDSTWGEVAPTGNVLIEYAKNHSNLIITPHIGGYGRQSIIETRRFVTRKFIDAVSG